MQELEEKVIKTIKKYNLIEENDRIVLGVSGGPDSMCMLNVLKNCQKDPSLMAMMTMKTFKIVVAHVNHLIRDEAKSDEEYVKSYCEKNGIEFYSKSIDVKKIANTNKIGLEEAGRSARYEFFNEILSKIKLQWHIIKMIK